MGMFDQIKVLQDLEIPEELKNLNFNWKEHNFQTKDLNNCLSDYFISEDGRLYEIVVEREYVPYTDQEKKSNGIKPWELWKDVKIISTTNKQNEHHGKINFYTYEHLDDEHDFWIEYDAYFIYGKLDKIVLNDYKKETSLSIRNEEIRKQREKEAATLWNRFKRIASYLGWKWFWTKAARLCGSTSSHLSKIQTFIYRQML